MQSPSFTHTSSETLSSFKPTPSIESLLQSNEPPHHSSVSALISSRTSAEAYVSNINARIQQMQEEIASLMQKREEASSYLEKYKIILHPIRRIPAEILAETFFLCTADLTNPLCPSEMPWVLGQVCRGWRNVALSAPKIYSNVALKLDKLADKNTSTSVSMLAAYLQRSREYPLTICIFSDYPQHPLLSLMYLSSYRWRKAFLSLSIAGFQALSSHIRGSVPILEILNVYARMQPNENRLTWDRTYANPIDAFEFAPKLHCLYAKCIPNIYLSFRMPFHQITRFHCIVDPQADTQWRSKNPDILSILKQLTSLTECQLDCCFSPDLPLHTPMIGGMTLPHLQTLVLTYTGQQKDISHITQILDNLTLPSLKELHVFPKVRSVDTEALVGMTGRSRCKLNRLHLHRTPVDEVRLLRAFPTVEVLAMKVTESMLKTMMVPSVISGSNVTTHSPGGTANPFLTNTPGSSPARDPPLLPSLKTLKVFAQPSPPLQLLLVEMLESRCKHSQIEEVKDSEAGLADTSSTSMTITTSTSTSSNGTAGVSTIIKPLEQVSFSSNFSFSEPNAKARFEALVKDVTVRGLQTRRGRLAENKHFLIDTSFSNALKHSGDLSMASQ